MFLANVLCWMLNLNPAISDPLALGFLSSQREIRFNTLANMSISPDSSPSTPVSPYSSLESLLTLSFLILSSVEAFETASSMRRLQAAEKKFRLETPL
jgi:hypothetical protein